MFGKNQKVWHPEPLETETTVAVTEAVSEFAALRRPVDPWSDPASMTSADIRAQRWER